MKLPLSWLQEFVTVGTPEMVAETFSAGGFGATVMHGQGLAPSIVVGKVLTVEAHPNADRLRVATVDIGKGRRWQIVCGATNLAPLQYVPVALPGTVLPNGTEIKTAEIRGVNSRGMICSETELGLAKTSEGIMTLDEATPGTAFAKLLGLDEIVVDLEIPPNRPDLLSVMGCGREYAALANASFRQPRWKRLDRARANDLRVSIQAKDGCALYAGRKIENVKIKTSPYWLQRRLRASGVRPINAVVDVTNFTMLETGQPLHAFSHTAFPKNQIIVRHAKANEKFHALDGKTYALPASTVVIANDENAVAIAGIMGGEATGVTNATTSVVLEAAVFDPVMTRRSAKLLQLSSESSYRFERRVDPLMTLDAFDRASALIAELTGGTIGTGFATGGAVRQKKTLITVSRERMNTMLSLRFTPAASAALLKRTGSAVRTSQKSLSVTPPHWRADLEREEDVIEEVARIYGYERLERTYPMSAARPSAAPKTVALERQLTDVLVGFGASELKLHPWYSDVQATDAGLAVSDHVAIVNPASADARLLRMHVHPNLLRAAALAARANSMVFCMETGRVFRTGATPFEEDRVSFVVVGDSAYRRAKGYCLAAFEAVGVRKSDIHLEPMPHPLGSGEKVLGKHAVGHIVRLSPDEQARWKFRREAAVVEVSLSALVALPRQLTSAPFSQYPPVLRDVSFWISPETPFAKIAAVFDAEPAIAGYDVFDVFEKDGQRGLALHLTFQSEDRTLDAKEVDEKLSRLTAILMQQFNATIR